MFQHTSLFLAHVSVVSVMNQVELKATMATVTLQVIGQRVSMEFAVDFLLV